MSIARQIAKGTLWNWAAMVVVTCVSFFLSPFLVHHLGDAGYGTWILINSIVEYLFLLDLGMRGAVTKFVSGAHAQQDHAQASRTFSAAFWFRLWMGVAMIVVSAALALLAPHFFHLPAELVVAAQWATLFNGVAVAVALTFGVFGGVLAGMQRFDVLSILTIGQTVSNAAGVVVLLLHGRGIASLAALQVGVSLVVGLATVIFAR